MKIALIPPVPDLDKFALTDIHLLLSHLFDHREYVEYYKQRRDRGDYLILDNSAHEHGVGNSAQDLLRQSARVSAQEVVVPDVLFDARGTVESARDTLKWMATSPGKAAYTRAGRPRLMYVPQGDNKGEWGWCLRRLLSLHQGFQEELNLEVPVVGISKDYYFWHRGHGLANLIESFLLLPRTQLGIDVHCLGWPTDLWALAEVAHKFPWVRSTDSAKPFVYAKDGTRLEPGGEVPEYPHRDEHYFDDPLPEGAYEDALRNVEVFRAAATNMLITG